MTYTGITTRGRRVTATSLQDCVVELAWALGRDPLDLITAYRDASSWYVYPSQTALDTDLQRHSGDPVSWVGIISTETL